MNYQDMTLNKMFLGVVNSIPTKIYEVLSTTWGWVDITYEYFKLSETKRILITKN